MGNFWIAQFDSSSSSPCSTRPSSPVVSKNNSNGGTHSGARSAFSSSMDDVFPSSKILLTSNVRTFSFAELKTATRNFAPDALIGEGGSGRVFKGWINEKTFAPAKVGRGMAIAVRKFESEGTLVWEKFVSVVHFLRGVSHPNLVKLLGYCWEDKELLLVYDFIPRGDLAKRLFRRSSAFQPLSWSIRLKIAIGAAQGLAFLHTSKRPIIYRDVKTSNILLDLNYNAKISDFGIAMSGPYENESSYVETCVLGTDGYAAPEYLATGHLYVKSDVYGFGVVLLEMLSGLRALDKNRPRVKQNLVEWARPYLSDQRQLLSQVMDKQLEGQYPSEGAVQAAQLILKCLVS